MKRCLVLLLCLLLLCGCQGMYPDDYLSVESNQAPYAYRETTVPSTTAPAEDTALPKVVSSFPEIRKGIQDLVSEGKTTGVFLLQNYRGDTENLSEIIRNYFLTYSPKYLYAIEEFELTEEASGADILLRFRCKPAISAEEFNAITTKQYADAIPLIYNALIEQKSVYTIEIINYVDTDFNKLLDAYFLEHPDVIIDVPQIELETFPEEAGTNRVLKFKFQYHTEPEDLQWQQKTVTSLLESYQTQFRTGDSPQQLLDAMYKLLVPAAEYQNDENATAYTLFLKKVGSSRMMASVAAFFCVRAEKDCGVVVGTHKVVKMEEGGEETVWEPWYWNWILDEDEYLFFDLHDAALKGVEPVLRRREDLTEYRWDPERYPQFAAPEPIAPTEPQETLPDQESTEAPSAAP